jgi:hypothetical protein
MATFFSYNALVSQRASGYKNTTFALAELIDNSFDAQAKTVRIVFIEKKTNNRRHVEEVLILDDGSGMSDSVLQEALQFGKTTNHDIDEIVKSKKKGKFGYGLPNASLSQCPDVHVYSWQDGQIPGHVYLDLDELRKGASIEIPPVKKDAFPSYYKDYLPVIGKSGTLVVWRRCDRLSHAKGETIIQNSQTPLGRLYRHLLAAGKKIEFCVYLQQPGKPVETTSVLSVVPNDPLFLLVNTQLAPVLWSASQASEGEKTAAAYKMFSKSKTECLATNIRLTDKCYVYPFEWLGRTYAFEIITSYADLAIQKPGIREGGNTRVGFFYGQKEREGNISFVRAEREIAAGNFGFYKATDARHRWWSIEVRFDADADDLIGVHNNKQGIEFVCTIQPKLDGDDEFNKHEASLLQARQELWKELSNCIEDARKTAFALVKQQHTKWDAEHLATTSGEDGVNKPQVPKGTETTAGVIKNVDGARKQPMPDASKQELVNRLQEKYPDIHKEEIVSAVTALDKAMVRACVLYAPSEASQLWSFTKVFDFLVVLINTRHEFYSRVMSELRSHGQEGALSAIELFISSLAVEEEKFVTRVEDAEIIEEFRTFVGIHLHNYIKRLPADMAMVPGSIDDDEEKPSAS